MTIYFNKFMKEEKKKKPKINLILYINLLNNPFIVKQKKKK